MHDFRTPFWATAALLSGPVLFFRGFGVMRERQLIANTPASRIRSMPMGLVEINGTVEPRSAVQAPFSGKACVYWEVDITVASEKGSFHQVHRNQSGHPFYLRDKTGVAVVYPKGAECKINFGVSEICSGLNLPPCYADYMKEYMGGVSALYRVSSLQFRERVIEPGTSVFVLGTATPRSHAVSVSEVEELGATGTDDRVAARLHTNDDQAVAVVRKGENEATFIISETSERGLMFNLGAQAFWKLVGGPVLTVLGLGYWLMVLASHRTP